MTFLLQTLVRPLFETRDVLSLIAITVSIMAFIFAPRYQKSLEREKEAHSRRVNVFKVLMATRGARLSYRHVEALNMVDLEFFGPKYASVKSARDNYYDNLNNRGEDPNFATTWLRTNDDLLSALICEMGKILGYNYSLVDIKRNVYTPQAHVDVEADDILIRKSLVALLQKREGYLPIYFEGTQDEAVTEKQSQLQELMIKYYSQKIENK